MLSISMDVSLVCFENLPTFIVPTGYGWNVLYGAVALFLLTAVCYVGASFFAKTSLLILFVLLVSLLFSMISLAFQSPKPEIGYTGWSLSTFVENFYYDFGKTEPDPKNSLFGMFGVLFPACTGIMAGVNMWGI